MKNLFQFLTEATAAGAKAQAAKLNLKSDGHGGWLDTRGNFVAKTEGAPSSAPFNSYLICS